MKKIIVFVVLLLMLSGIFTNQSLAATNLKDVEKSNRFYNEIQYLINEEVISGFPDGTFRPKSNVTRAQAAIMIGRAMGYDGKQRNTSFSDVSSSKVASGYIAEATENSLISGYPDGTFKPDKVVTRAEMAIILNRAFFNKTITPTVSFSDVGKKMSSYYSIMNLAAMGIVSGYEDGTFKPNNSLNREQFSAFLARAFNADFIKSPDKTETVSQQQAIKKAKSYLEYTSFSRSGLIAQLEYEGFSNADAKYAVDKINVNWRGQAVKMAENYLEYTSFSRSGLIAQLEYEGFSNADATYAVDKINVNWREQAVKMAKNYLEYTSFSRSGLIAQLEFEGFSNADATYAVNAVGL
ncbi:S-layer homology domain-containing protein [Planococcus kocurii]|uniref:S-layer homology domain-containing protein n=1 Tax=Planococcus kocurii TaxID=1374 RepID=UPI0009E6B499|nr:S-layer homology domain-containing protein [Planococcus kocurii]